MKLVKPSFTILTEVKTKGTRKEIRGQYVSIVIVCNSDVFTELKHYNPFAVGARYGNFVIPPWSVIQPGEGTQSNFGLLPLSDIIWLNCMQNAEELYLQLCRSGIHKSKAVCVLPASAQRTITITKRLSDWKLILSKVGMSEDVAATLKPIREALEGLINDAKIF